METKNTVHSIEHDTYRIIIHLYCSLGMFKELDQKDLGLETVEQLLKEYKFEMSDTEGAWNDHTDKNNHCIPLRSAKVYRNGCLLNTDNNLIHLR